MNKANHLFSYASVCFTLCSNKCMSKMSCLLFPCYFVLKLVSSALFSLSPGLHALHAEDETPGEVKRGAGMEFCSIYHPEIFLLERHTLFSLSLYSLHCSSLCPCSPSHFSSLCDMWSFHFIPGWLSSALKHCCCPPIPSCSIAGSTGLHRPVAASYNSPFPHLQSRSAVGTTFSTFLYCFTILLFYLWHPCPLARDTTHIQRDCQVYKIFLVYAQDFFFYKTVKHLQIFSHKHSQKGRKK